MRIGIDIDGTINSNIAFWSQFTEYHKKALSSASKAPFNHEIHIITSRHRELEEYTRTQLNTWGIRFDFLVLLDHPFDTTSIEERAKGKALYCKKKKIDIIYDNDLHLFYEIFKEISPRTALVLI